MALRWVRSDIQFDFSARVIDSTSSTPKRSSVDLSSSLGASRSWLLVRSAPFSSTEDEEDEEEQEEEELEKPADDYIVGEVVEPTVSVVPSNSWVEVVSMYLTG